MRPLATHLGDDLDQARAFATSALADMDMLLSDLRLDSAQATKTLLNIQIEAKKMQARGIYRAAHSVVESYQNHHKQPKIDGRLMVLYKLVVQYNNGVEEIMIPAETLGEIEGEIGAETRAESPVQTRVSQATSHHANYVKAKNTLKDLLPFAKTYKDSIERLMALNMEAPIDTPKSTSKKTTSLVSFESLMPEITDTALRNARGEGKSVSISYAAEHLFIEDSQVEQVRAQLDQIVERLVRNKIATPAQRQNAGLPRSGHIDVSAEQGAKGLNISILCEGETIRLKPQTSNINAAPLQEVGT